MRKYALMLIALTLVLATAAWADTEHVIYNFASLTGDTDGYNPYSALVADKSGNLYGTAEHGGSPSGYGVVFELKPSGGGFTETVLHQFAAGTTDGAYPLTSLVMDSSGNLYGMTYQGGASNLGTVFEMTKTNGKWTEKLIHSFAGGGKDGYQPDQNELSFDSSGNLYGTVQTGGTHGYGIVFQMTQSKGKWSYRTIHNFNAGNDGAYPYGALVAGANGFFYGATYEGGPIYNAGTVFELFESRSVWTGKTIYYFSGGYPGETPLGGVVFYNGNLFGTTYQGGTDNLGTIFELKAGSNNKWTQSVVYNFAGGTGDGEHPYYGDGLIVDGSGNLYGMTYQAGLSGAGVVYELENNKGVYKEKVLYNFAGGGGDGCNPQANLVMVKSNFFGTTPGCGAHGGGVAFEIKP